MPTFVRSTEVPQPRFRYSFGVLTSLLTVICILLLPPRTAMSEDLKSEKQTVCPVYTDRPVFTTSRSQRYRGIKVYFSNADAFQRFSKHPDQYLDTDYLPQLKGLTLPKSPIEQKFCPVYRTRKITSAGPSVTHRGVKIYFFDSAARFRFQRNPEKYLDRELLPQLPPEEKPKDDPESTAESARLSHSTLFATAGLSPVPVARNQRRPPQIAGV